MGGGGQKEGRGAPASPTACLSIARWAHHTQKEKEHIFHCLHVDSGRTSTDNGVQSNGPGAWVTRNCSPAPKISLVVTLRQGSLKANATLRGGGCWDQGATS